MGMFDRYENIDPTYIPNNTSPTLDNDNLTTIDSFIPRPLTDYRGRKIGYTWENGELFDFNIEIVDEIVVREDALIYNEPGKFPDVTTIGKYRGQQAYNTVDAKSWTYTGTSGDLQVWEIDEELLYPLDGTKSIEVYPNMKGKYSKLDIYNFRWELVHSIENELGSNNITLKVDENLSALLERGIYYATLTICSESSKFLKSKFIISIN